MAESPAVSPAIEPIEVEVLERQVKLTRAPQRAAITFALLAELSVHGDRIFIGEPVENEHIYQIIGLTDDCHAVVVELVEKPL